MMKIDSSSNEKVGQINGFKLLLSAWLQSTIRIVNYYPDIRIIRISVSALLHTDFQLTVLSGRLVGVKSIRFFIHKSRSRICDIGWVLCHISMAFNWIPFKPQKGTPTIVTPST